MQRLARHVWHAVDFSMKVRPVAGAPAWHFSDRTRMTGSLLLVQPALKQPGNTLIVAEATTVRPIKKLVRRGDATNASRQLDTEHCWLRIS